MDGVSFNKATINDYNYSVSVNGPNTAYNFDKASPVFDGTYSADDKDKITINVKAYGNGTDILDSEIGTATYSSGSSSGGPM